VLFKNKLGLIINRVIIKVNNEIKKVIILERISVSGLAEQEPIFKEYSLFSLVNSKLFISFIIA
jgi:hypothetical protein